MSVEIIRGKYTLEVSDASNAKQPLKIAIKDLVAGRCVQ